MSTFSNRAVNLRTAASGAFQKVRALSNPFDFQGFARILGRPKLVNASQKWLASFREFAMMQPNR